MGRDHNHNCQQNHYPHNLHPPHNLYHQAKVSLSKITAKIKYNHLNFYHNHYYLQNHNCQQNHNIPPPPNLYHQAKVKSKSKSKPQQDHSKKAGLCWEAASGKFGTDPQIIFKFFNCPGFSIFVVCLFVIRYIIIIISTPFTLLAMSKLFILFRLLTLLS